MGAKHLKVLVLCDCPFPPRPDRDFSAELKTEDWKAESDVLKALASLGHETAFQPVHDDVNVILEGVRREKPDIVFNLMEEFAGRAFHERNLVGLLELLGVPYTGSGPMGMMLCKNKALTKQVLSHRRIKNARFDFFPVGRRVKKKPAGLRYPLIVKPMTNDASYGISQASFVETDGDFADRVRFLHQTLGQGALAEEYIDGRELYVGVMGNERLAVFPAREMMFRQVPDGTPKIATFKAKWDDDYRRRWGIGEAFAEGLPGDVVRRVEETAKRTYRALRITGYGRMDMRLTPAGEVVVMEANPNPFLAEKEDFALSADKAGFPFPQLIQKILSLGLERRPKDK